MRLLRTALHNRAIARLEAAWAMSSLAMWAFSILLALYAYGKGGAGAVGLAMVVRLLPSLVAAPYTALLADRRSRRDVLIGCSIFRAAALGLTGLVIGTGGSLVVVLVGAVIVTGAGTAQRPAQAALLPLLARSPAELAAANVAWTGFDNLSFLVGSALAGVLAAATGLGTAFGLSAIPFLLAVFPLLRVPRDPPAPPKTADSPFRQILAGFQGVRSHKGIRILVGVFGAEILVQTMLDVLIVVLALAVLGVGRGAVGWLSAALGAGGVAGGAVALALLRRGRLVWGIAGGCTLAGFSIVVLSLTAQPGIAALVLVICGAGFGVLEIALLALTQRLASADVLARIFGVNEVVDIVGSAVGAGGAAGLVALLGGRTALVVTGLLLPLVAVALRGRLSGYEAATSVPGRAFELVRGLPFAAVLPVATIESLAVQSTAEQFEPGEAIVRQGDAGDRIYVIDSGTVTVERDGVTLRRMTGGEFFGEIALLRDIPRTATVSAATAVSAVVIARREFLAAISSHPRSRTSVETIAAERYTPVAEPS